MDRIEGMGVFAKVIEKQSFSGAARELRLPQAAVSNYVRALEDWLGARLLDRTTRRLNVTELGALGYFVARVRCLPTDRPSARAERNRLR